MKKKYDIINIEREVSKMDKEKAFKMVIECITVVVENGGGLQSTSNVNCAINWNFSEIKEIIDRYLKKEKE